MPSHTIVRIIGALIAASVVGALVTAGVYSIHRLHDVRVQRATPAANLVVPQSEELPENISHLNIIAAADVTVRPVGDDELATIKQFAKDRHEVVPWQITTDSSGQTTVTAECATADRLLDRCPQEILAVVPAQVAVTVQNSFGNVTVADLSGAVKVISDAGQVALARNAGAVTAQLSAGEIDVTTGVTAGPVQVEVDFGQLRYNGVAGVSPAVSLAVKTGDLQVVLGADQEIDIQATSRVGDVRNTFGTSPNAANQLTAEVSIGEVSISAP